MKHSEYKRLRSKDWRVRFWRVVFWPCFQIGNALIRWHIRRRRDNNLGNRRQGADDGRRRVT